MNRQLFFIFIILFCAKGLPQQANRNFKGELDYQSHEIQNLQKALEEARRQLKKEEGKEKSATKKISGLDQEISLMDRLIQKLLQEEKSTAGEIRNLENKIDANHNSLKELQDRYAKRVVNMYKKGTLSPMERILSSTSWRQAVYRGHYLKIISDIDRQAKKQIQALIVDIRQKKLDLVIVNRKKSALKRERLENKKILRGKKIVKEKELTKIRKNKKELANYVKEQQAGIAQLEAVYKKILKDKDRFEREERIRKQQEALSAKSFAELKGKLSWPANGRVITNFGRQWNAELKTTTESPGIDIKGKPGSPIKSVQNGVVTIITYIRGYGTTIIVDHGGGFYTVYSHVNNIQTNVDSAIQMGDVLAYMGDSGSINGSMLHFEVWGKGKKLDPKKWLKKQ